MNREALKTIVSTKLISMKTNSKQFWKLLLQRRMLYTLIVDKC